MWHTAVALLHSKFKSFCKVPTAPHITITGLSRFYFGLYWISVFSMSLKIFSPVIVNANYSKANSSVTSNLPAAAAAKSLQSFPTLCDPRDSSPPGSPVPGILQARTLEWVAISSSNAWKWEVKVKSLSHIRLLATPWTAAYQAPPTMGFSRQEYWSRVPLPSPNLTWDVLNAKLGKL